MTCVAFCHKTLDVPGLKFLSFWGIMRKDFFISSVASLESFVAYVCASVLFEENRYDFASFYLFALRKIFAVKFF